MSTIINIPEGLDVGSYDYSLRQKARTRRTRHESFRKDKQRRERAKYYLGYYKPESYSGHTPSTKKLVPAHDEWVYFEQSVLFYEWRDYYTWRISDGAKRVQKILGLTTDMSREEWDAKVEEAFRTHKIIGEKVPTERRGIYDHMYKIKVHVPEHVEVSMGERIDIPYPDIVVRLRHYSTRYFKNSSRKFNRGKYKHNLNKTDWSAEQVG